MPLTGARRGGLWTYSLCLGYSLNAHCANYPRSSSEIQDRYRHLSWKLKNPSQFFLQSFEGLARATTGYQKMTFITVKYGDNEQRLFNPYCSSLILLECIRKNCNITDVNATLDLSDALGNVKRLPDNLHSYANALLEGRETYWLIKVDKGVGEADPTKYTLLIDDPEKNCPELSSRLQDLSRPPTRTRKESQWSNLRRKLPRNKGSGRPKSNTGKKR